MILFLAAKGTANLNQCNVTVCQAFAGVWMKSAWKFLILERQVACLNVKEQTVGLLMRCIFYKYYFAVFNSSSNDVDQYQLCHENISPRKRLG